MLRKVRESPRALIPCLARIIHDGSSRNGEMARDKREERDLRDMCALSLLVALFPPVSPVSLESETA